MGSGSSMCGRSDEDTMDSSDNNPLNEFNKKERGLIRDTWSQIDDPKTVVGKILLELIDTFPEIKPVFGVKMVPPATVLKMPIAGGHVKQFVELFDSITNLLGFLDNALGAQQLLRKVGRSHARIPLIGNQPKITKQGVTTTNYIELFLVESVRHLLPYLTEDQSKQSTPDDDRKVRFAQSYSAVQVESVWHRFVLVCASQVFTAYENELRRQKNEASLNIMAPQQRIEEKDKLKKQMKEKMDHQATTSSEENKPPDEQMYEDPF